MASGGEPSDQRRVSGRIRVNDVRTNVGTVIDASAGGLRIRGKAPKGCEPGTSIRVEITDGEVSVTVDCEIRWMQRHPFKGATFGVSFIDPSDEQRRDIFTIIRRAGTEARCRWDAA